MDLNKIKGLLFDVDGVFTDGGILCDLKGELFRTFNAKDCFGVRMAVMNGYHVGIITGADSPSVIARFLTCGLDKQDIYLCSKDKIKDLKDFCKRHGIGQDEVMFMGDDLPDINSIKMAGLGVCPADAVAEVREAADLITPQPGGRGAVRYIVRNIMKVQEKWNFDVDTYEKRF